MIYSIDGLDQLAAALVAAQSDMTNPPLDGVNPHFKSKFTTLAAMTDHVRPILAKHGLAIIQHPVSEDDGIGVRSILVHSSGQFLEESYTMPLAKVDPQAVGSVVTYLRRYALAAFTGVQGDEDTDAQGVMAQPVAAPATRPQAPPVTASAEEFAPNWANPKATVVTWGKHKGKTLEQVGGDYADFMLKKIAEDGNPSKIEDILKSFKEQLIFESDADAAKSLTVDEIQAEFDAELL